MDGLRVQQSPGDARSSATGVVMHAPVVRREDPMIVRRRHRTLQLLGATVGALGVAPFVGGGAWVVAGGLVTTSLVTVVALRRLKVQRDAARSVLVSLDLRRPAQPLVDEITGELLVAAGSSASAVRLPSWRG